MHGSHAALPIACDALNARTVAVREYHYIFCAVVARNVGGLSVWTPCAMIGAYVMEIPLFSFLTIRSYCKHTVNGPCIEYPGMIAARRQKKKTVVQHNL